MAHRQHGFETWVSATCISYWMRKNICYWLELTRGTRMQPAVPRYFKQPRETCEFRIAIANPFERAPSARTGPGPFLYVLCLYATNRTYAQSTARCWMHVGSYGFVAHRLRFSSDVPCPVHMSGSLGKSSAWRLGFAKPSLTRPDHSLPKALPASRPRRPPPPSPRHAFLKAPSPVLSRRAHAQNHYSISQGGRCRSP